MANSEPTIDETIRALTEWAGQIRREGIATRRPTTDEDAALLEHAAELLERLRE
jgi:hypothetical protein